MNLQRKRTIIFLLLLGLEASRCCSAAADSTTTTMAANSAAPASRAVANVKAEVVPPSTPTLWELMARMHSEELAAETRKKLALAMPRRLPLGVLPGFTVPAAPEGSEPLVAATMQRKEGGFFGSVSQWLEHLGKITGTKVQVTGHSTFTMEESNVSNNSLAGQSYNSQTYLGRGSNGFYNDTNMDINATFFHALTYHTHISNDLYGTPGQNRFELDYSTKNLKVNAGDINASLQGNSLIAFSRYLSGIKLSDLWNRHFSTTLLVSQTAATPHTMVIPGNNTAGPYYLFAGQIVDGSVQVRVDNQPINPQAYTMDTMTGQLTFNNNKVILSSSTIAVTYETTGYDQSQGSIYGFRADYAFNHGTHAGFTYLTQQTQGSTAPQVRLQQFYGNQSPLSPYVLDYPVDTTRPVSVKVAGVPVPQGVGFTIDAQYPNEIRLVQGVPATETVTISYYPAQTNVTPGNRNVVGLDTTFDLGSTGRVTMESAFSGLSLSGKSVNGQALQLSASLNPARHLTTNITLKDIGPSFAAIESPGFNQNEKSVSLSSTYNPSRKVNISFNWEKAKRPSYQSFSTGTTLAQAVGNDTYNQYGINVQYTPLTNTTLALSRNTTSTDFYAGGNSSNSTDSLSLNYTAGTLGLRAGLSHNVSDTASIISSLAGTTTSPVSGPLTYNTDTLSKEFSLQWAPRSWMQFNGSIVQNNTTSTGNQVSLTGTQSTSTTSQAGMRFNLKNGMQLSYSYTLTDSGNGLTSGSTTTGNGTGTTTGTTSTGTSSTGTVTTRGVTLPTGTLLGGGTNSGLGSLGNYGGLLGGSTAATGLTSLSGKTSSQRVSLSYAPNRALNMSIAANLSNTVGTYQYNTNTKELDFVLGWQPHGGMAYSLSTDLAQTAYTGSLGGSNISTIQFDAEGHPFRSRLSVRFNYGIVHNQSSINTSAIGGTTSTGTSSSVQNTSNDITSMGLRLQYPVSLRNALFVNWDSSVTLGYLGSTQTNLSFGWDYLLTSALKFELGWQLSSQVFQDSSQASYNYHVSSLIATLGLNF